MHPLQVDPARQSDRRADQHLHTPEHEQPRARVRERLGEEEAAADDEPEADQNVVDAADDLVALPDAQLAVADVDDPRPRPVASVSCHARTPSHSADDQALPYRRLRFAYSSIAAHRLRRSTSGQVTSLNTISAYAACQIKKLLVRCSPDVRQNMSTSGMSASSR